MSKITRNDCKREACDHSRCSAGEINKRRTNSLKIHADNYHFNKNKNFIKTLLRKREANLGSRIKEQQEFCVGLFVHIQTLIFVLVAEGNTFDASVHGFECLPTNKHPQRRLFSWGSWLFLVLLKSWKGFTSCEVFF